MKQPDTFFHSLATADMDSINFTSLFEQMDDGVIMIKLPPLRERQGCLPALIYYFIEKYNKCLGTCIKWVAEDLWDLNMSHRA